ncbi:MAG: lysophospholipid acyltransferase family protein [Gammaproteobacteria bacterium]
MSTQSKSSTKARLIIAIMRIIARLPLGVAKAIMRPIAWLQCVLPNATKNVIHINLATCLPEYNSQQRKAIRNQNILFNADLFAEIVHIWFRDYQQIRPQIKHLHGVDAFQQALANDGGMLVVSPHYGNWELVWSYLREEAGCYGLYRPPRIKELEAIRLQGSEEERVVRTRAIDVRKMLKVLKQGSGLFLLPDQQPPDGSGEFAPFFGQPAYTMTLLHGLANRTNSAIWMATCVKGADGYTLSFAPLELDAQYDITVFNAELNRLMAETIREHPGQYQWSYKRFKKTADGSLSIYNQPGKKT